MPATNDWNCEIWWRFLLFRWCVQRRVSECLLLSPILVHIFLYLGDASSEGRRVMCGYCFFLHLLLDIVIAILECEFYKNSFCGTVIFPCKYEWKWWLNRFSSINKSLLVKRKTMSTNLWEFRDDDALRSELEIIMEKLNRAWIMNSENIFLHAIIVIIKMIPLFFVTIYYFLFTSLVAT